MQYVFVPLKTWYGGKKLICEVREYGLTNATVIH